MGVPKIKYFKQRAFILAIYILRPQSRYDVVDVSVVSTRVPVAVQADWFPRFDLRCELVDGEVRPLPRAIYGEESETDDGQPTRCRDRQRCIGCRIYGVGSSMAYAAAKAGVIAMTKSLARALAPEIRVNAISPGLIRTHFAGRPNSSSDFTAEEMATPLKRLATVDECAEVALFLASSATAITGQTILVDGGLYVLGPNR